MTISAIKAARMSVSDKINEKDSFSDCRKNGLYYVNSGTTLYSLAKAFGISTDDFKKKYKISELKAGTQISNLPTVEYKSGKLKTFVENELGMDYKTFCKLNNIPLDYQPVKGEKFFSVNMKKTNTQENNPSRKSVKETVEKDKKPKKELKPEVKDETKSETKTIQKPAAPDSAEGIALALKKSANKWGAVGKKEFNETFGKINKNNVIEVIKSYYEISPHESLIEMIADEITSNEADKKSAIINLYNILEQRAGKNIATDAKHKEFAEELDSQYNSFSGKVFNYVSTDKLDKIIKNLAGIDIIEENEGNNEVITGDYIPLDDPNGSKKIYIQNSKEMKALESLRKDAIYSGKKEMIRDFDTFCYIQTILKYCEKNNVSYNDLKLDFNNPEEVKSFCVNHGLNKIRAKLDLSEVDRPLPNVDKSGLKITTYINEPLKKNKQAKGLLGGKTIIINPGHGGYNYKNGYFDPGAFSFAKTGKDTYKPIQEYEILDDYTEDLVKKLKNEGADVVIMRGHVKTLYDEKAAQKLAQKYGQDAMLISLHCDKEIKKGSGVLYLPSDNNDVSLKKSLMLSIGEKFDNVQEFPRNELYVLKNTPNIPSVLLEIEYLNGLESSRILDKDYKKDYISAVMKGIKQYYGE